MRKVLPLGAVTTCVGLLTMPVARASAPLAPASAAARHLIVQRQSGVAVGRADFQLDPTGGSNNRRSDLGRYTLSGQLNELGFMGYLGLRFANAFGGLHWVAVYLILAGAYVLLHYLFVSQTAHVLALFGVFLGVGVKLGVPATPLAFVLLFASNFFSAITPQGSSANLLFAGSGHLTQGELYKLGTITTAFNILVLLLVGTPWLLFTAR